MQEQVKLRAELIRQVGQALQPRARATWCIPLTVSSECLRRQKDGLCAVEHQVARTSLRFAHPQPPLILID